MHVAAYLWSWPGLGTHLRENPSFWTALHGSKALSDPFVYLMLIIILLSLLYRSGNKRSKNNDEALFQVLYVYYFI